MVGEEKPGVLPDATVNATSNPPHLVQRASHGQLSLVSNECSRAITYSEVMYMLFKILKYEPYSRPENGPTSSSVVCEYVLYLSVSYYFA